MERKHNPYMSTKFLNALQVCCDECFDKYRFNTNDSTERLNEFLYDCCCDSEVMIDIEPDSYFKLNDKRTRVCNRIINFVLRGEDFTSLLVVNYSGNKSHSLMVIELAVSRMEVEC